MAGGGVLFMSYKSLNKKRKASKDKFKLCVLKTKTCDVIFLVHFCTHVLFTEQKNGIILDISTIWFSTFEYSAHVTCDAVILCNIFETY